jgi:hypothetical protein
MEENAPGGGGIPGAGGRDSGEGSRASGTLFREFRNMA